MMEVDYGAVTSAPDLSGEAEAYQDIAWRLGLLPEGEAYRVLDLGKHRKRGASSRRPRAPLSGLCLLDQGPEPAAGLAAAG